MNKLTTIVLMMIMPMMAQDITNKLGGDTANETYDVTDSNDNVLFQVRGDGNTLVGTTSSQGKFSVGNDNSNGIYGTTNHSTSAGVKGTAGPTGANFGGHFSSSAMQGTGVYGEGNYIGGHFKSTTLSNGVGLMAEGTGVAAYFVGEVFVDGPVTTKTFLNLESASIDIDDGGTITPTTSYMRVYPLTNVTLNSTTAIADGVTVGQFLFIQNVNSSYTIIIPAGANVNGVSPITIGNYDTIQLLWDGNNWAHINN